MRGRGKLFVSTSSPDPQVLRVVCFSSCCFTCCCFTAALLLLNDRLLSFPHAQENPRVPRDALLDALLKKWMLCLKPQHSSMLLKTEATNLLNNVWVLRGEPLYLRKCQFKPLTFDSKTSPTICLLYLLLTCFTCCWHALLAMQNERVNTEAFIKL